MYNTKYSKSSRKSWLAGFFTGLKSPKRKTYKKPLTSTRLSALKNRIKTKYSDNFNPIFSRQTKQGKGVFRLSILKRKKSRMKNNTATKKVLGKFGSIDNYVAKVKQNRIKRNNSENMILKVPKSNKKSSGFFKKAKSFVYEQSLFGELITMGREGQMVARNKYQKYGAGNSIGRSYGYDD